MNRKTNCLAAGFREIGVGPGDRVAIMMDNDPDHVAAIFATVRLGATWVPVNVGLRGAALDLLLERSEPALVVADDHYLGILGEVIRDKQKVIYRSSGANHQVARLGLESLLGAQPVVVPDDACTPEQIVCITFTSGTTGEPKGVMLSAKSVRWTVEGCLEISGMEDGSRLYHWEPLCHMAGFQAVFSALVRRITLIMVPKFSASRFWSDARNSAATHVHYIGGIVQLLLKQPVSDLDRVHNVKVAFGGGCPKEVWRPFEERYGVEIREGYGTSEVSSYGTLNITGKVGSVGRPPSFISLKIVDDNGAAVPPGTLGEIYMKENVPGVVFDGYFRNPDATANYVVDGWHKTGDLGIVDQDGDLFFEGRKKDSIRRRGENISAWEVERVLNKYADVIESAVIAVKNDFGDEEVKAFVRVRNRGAFDFMDFHNWSLQNMPKYQVPRFVALIDEFPRTPSERVKKTGLSTTTKDCWDAENSVGEGGRVVFGRLSEAR